MYALPVLPPVTEVQEQRLEFLITDEQVSKSWKNCEERTSLIFLMQTHLFISLANNNEGTNYWDNYAVQALRNYEAYLRYLQY